MVAKRLFEASSLILAVPFLMGSSSTTKAGYMSECVYPALSSSESTYSFSNTYNYTHDVGYSQIWIELYAYHGPTGTPTITEVKYASRVEAEAGKSMLFRTSIDYSLFSKTGKTNANELRYTIKNAGYDDEHYIIHLNYKKSERFVITTESGSVSKNGATNWVAKFDGTYNYPARYEWKGFTQEIVDPQYSIFPLGQMKIRMYDQNQKLADFLYEEATLTISDATNFKMGQIVFVNGRKRRRLKLKAYQEPNTKYVSFKSATPIIYSHDFREVRADGVKREGDKESYHVFLPPVNNGDVRQTLFELSINKAGYEQSDYFYSKFSVYQSHNFIGSAPDSDYVVEEY